jgi:DNA-binding transcriptional ArsR family regulator
LSAAVGRGADGRARTRHLRVLEEAGLIHAALRGRERIYELDAGRLRTLTRGWLDRFDIRR